MSSIGNRAFAGCSALNTLTFAEEQGEFTIGDSAFYGDNALENIELPDTCTQIGAQAFAYCASLSELNLGSAVASIGDGAFFGNEELVIHAVSGSEAERYVENNTYAEIEFIKTDGPMTAVLPEISSIDHTTVTLKAVDGYEYKIGENGNWQSDPIFDGLLPLTQYKFYQRAAATNSVKEGVTSEPVTIVTGKRAGKRVKKPVILNVTENTAEVAQVQGCEYSLDGQAWSTEHIFTGLTAGREYTCYQRAAGNETTEAGAAASIVFRTNSPNECITVTFDANGGLVGIDRLQVSYGSKYGDMPLSIRDKYTFKGWFTEPEGGVAVNADTVVSVKTDHTLYAHWQVDNTSGGGNGEGDVDDKEENGGKDEENGKTNIKYVEPIEPGCTTNGRLAHWKNGSTGMLFLDEECTKQVTEAELMIPATGHQYETTRISRTATEPGYVVNTCKLCGDVVREEEVVESGKENRMVMEEGTGYTDKKGVTYRVYSGKMIKGQKISLGAGKWKSGKKSIASVGSKTGVVTAKKAGSVTIVNTKCDEDDMAAKYDLTVIAPTLSKKKLSIKVGDETELVLKGADEFTQTWFSSNRSVVTVLQTTDNEGRKIAKITATGKGTAQITAYVRGIAYTASVKVKDSADKTMPTKKEVYLRNGGSVTIKHNHINKKADAVEWSVTVSDIIQINVSEKDRSKVTITGKAAGETLLLCNTGDVTYSTIVHVEDISIATDDMLKLSSTKKNSIIYSLKLQVDGSYNFIFPNSDMIANWKSSDSSIVTVNEYGMMTALKKGKATVSAKIDGYTVKVSVNVVKSRP